MLNKTFTKIQIKEHPTEFIEWIHYLHDNGYGAIWDGVKYYAETKDVIAEKNELSKLRNRRQKECFDILTDKGYLWIKDLEDNYSERYAELVQWRKDWLDVTDTKIIPEKPTWID